MNANKKIYIDVKNPFVLEESNKVWMVLNGEINVFAVQIDENGWGNFTVPAGNVSVWIPE